LAADDLIGISSIEIGTESGIMFLKGSLSAGSAWDMASDLYLGPATADEIAETLAFALRYDGRKRVHDADLAMGRITAERLVRHLEQSGFLVMKRPPAAAPMVGRG
jgi:hypothetical protein